MKKSNILANSYAVSEVIGATLLVLIAVGAAASIYTQMLPVPIPPSEPNVHLMGSVTENGNILIEHMGGEILDSYDVYVNGTNVYTNPDDESLDVGEIIPSSFPTLLDEDDYVRIVVCSLNDDGSNSIVFDGILFGPGEQDTLPEVPPQIYSMPISSLRTNSVDEDIICYSSFLTPNLDPVTSYIYNWAVDRGGGFSSLASLYMPFDVNNAEETKDYAENNPNGAIYGSLWESNGVIGGAYSFDGDDYISLPYCFEEDFLDRITVEGWIKTSEPSGTIVSYERDNYWELALSGGDIKWTTNASDGTIDHNGVARVDDDTWHHIATTYDSSTGDSSIYVDGILDSTENIHSSGQVLGSGDTPIGFIGKGTGTVDRETIFSTGFETQDEKDQWNEDEEIMGITGEDEWETLWSDDFEGGNWGDWKDGGGDCTMYYSGTYAHQGSCAINIQDNSGWSSTTYTDNIHADTAEYAKMSIDFWWRARSMENGEDFWVNYYDGSTTHRLATLVIGTGEYSNNVFYHTICSFDETEYGAFTDSAQFRIQCDASGNYDDVYLDEIYINASTESRLDYDFNLRDSTVLNPKTGTYSIGGTGELEPEYAAFNRSSIDISAYINVKLSVWYSYKNTEDADFFGFYYKDVDGWETIFEVDSPDMGSGQSDWVNVEADIPNYVDDLVIQFKWMTSSASEYMAIDDLAITGILPSGENNFTGLIDELKIYNEVLSSEQIYQNYLQTKDGDSIQNVIVSEETSVGELWKCIVTPNNGIINDVSTESDVLLIVSYEGGE